MDFIKLKKDIDEHPLTFLLLYNHIKHPSKSDTELAMWIMKEYEDKIKQYPLDTINNDFALFNKLSSEQREAFAEIMKMLTM